MRAVAVAVIAAAVDVSEAARTFQQSQYAYEEFRHAIGDDHSHTTTSYNTRIALFEQRREAVERHNAQPGISWKAAVNRFTDYTPEEFNALLGHRPLARSGMTIASFLQMKPSAPLATSVDWSTKLQNNISKLAKNQGGCGSCWAVATTGALETHAEVVHGHVVSLSYEQLVDCTPNPEDCGGTGKCDGATSELAMQYVKVHGVLAAPDYQGYQTGSGAGECKPISASPALTISDWVRLDTNKLHPLLVALSTHGPVVVSADASDWGAYDDGVFHGCGVNATINHAILAMGYGHSETHNNMDYWLIRNSWGPSWGEHGYIRLRRHAEENAHCGTDFHPEQGVGCKGGEATLPVCGECGILADSAYPTGVQVVKDSDKDSD